MGPVVRDRMNYLYRIIIVATLVGNLSAPETYAEDTASCQELIQDCFAAAAEQRDTCLQTVATNVSCTSSDVGALVTKRAQFSTMKLVPDQGPAFLGPQIIDRRCVTNFDSTWSAALVKGPLSKERLASLSAALDECAASDIQSIPHP